MGSTYCASNDSNITFRIFVAMVLERHEELNNKADDSTREIRDRSCLMTCESIAAVHRNHALDAIFNTAKEAETLAKAPQRYASQIVSHQIDTYHGTNWLDVSNRHAVIWKHSDHRICREAQVGKIDTHNRESSSYPR
jgi:hypothetical protein